MIPCRVLHKSMWSAGYYYLESVLTAKGVRAVCADPKGFMIYVELKNCQLDMECLKDDEDETHNSYEFRPDFGN